MAQESTSRGRRFLRAMAQRGPDADRPLPVGLRRLADMVVGPGHAATVRVRTGPSTQSALRQAERPAATVGRVIHLDRPPDGSSRSAEIVAHELVHTVRPSAVPRFFDDDHHSAEEEQAGRAGRRVAELIRAFEGRAEAGGTNRAGHLAWGTAGLAVGPGASPLTAGAVGQVLAERGHRRPGSGAPGDTSGGSTDTSSASHRVRRPSGRHRTGQPATGGYGSAANPVAAAEFLAELPPAVARLVSGGYGAPSDPAAASSSPGSPAPLDPAEPGAPFSRPQSPFGGDMPATLSVPTEPSPPYIDSSHAPISAETLDWIVDAVEERILAELERRGMRFQPGVF